MFELSTERSRRLDEILARYPTKMAACLPALRLAQEEVGHVTPDVMDWVARRLELPVAHVQGVVTFYTLFDTKPVGRHKILACRTLSCALRGAEELIDHVCAATGCRVGGTSADGLFTVQTAECLASCGTAPAFIVDGEFHENLTREKIDALVAKLRDRA